MLLRTGIVLLAPVAWLAWDWWRGDPAIVEPPPNEVVRAFQPGDGEPAPPTRGMRVGEEGFGTVTSAPIARVAPGEPMPLPPTLPLVADDVARFVRMVQVRVPNPQAVHGPPTVCTLEMPPHRQGRLILADGCLRLAGDEADLAAAPLVELSRGLRLFRDPEGYLALGNAGSAEHQLRVGEPQGIIVGIGCSQDRPFPAAPEARRACGAPTAIRIGSVARVPLCTPARSRAAERLKAEQARREREAAARADRCEQENRAACPPRAIPPLPPEAVPPCRPSP